VRGWAYSRTLAQLNAVQIRHSEGWKCEGVYGFHRPDVSVTYPEAGHANLGWEVRVILPAGKHRLVIEFCDSTGKWSFGAELAIEMRPSRIPRWLPGSDMPDLLCFQFPAHASGKARNLAGERFPQRGRNNEQLPSISIVTPSYQQAWALGRCMNSVLGEHGVPLQYVVQDGGSTDGSADLIRSHEAKLAAWESAPDGGQTHAIVLGFAKTSGRPTDLMAWINSDDFYMPGALRFVTEYFAQHPSVDVVYGHRVVVNREGQEIARWFLPKHDSEVLRLNDFVPQETLFWRRRIWDKVGGLDTSFQFAMDWDLLLRFQAAGAKIVRVPYFLGCFRIHAQQKTSAQISTVGQAEIDRLRERTFGRKVAPAELETSPLLHRYLRKSAWIEQLWKWGIRAR